MKMKSRRQQGLPWQFRGLHSVLSLQSALPLGLLCIQTQDPTGCVVWPPKEKKTA